LRPRSPLRRTLDLHPANRPRPLFHGSLSSTRQQAVFPCRRHGSAPLLSGGPVADDRSLTIDHVSLQQAPLFVEQRSNISGAGRSAFTPQASFAHNDRTVADLSAFVPLPGRLFVSKRDAHSK